MITSRFCKSCGSKNTFDDSNEKFFCSFCGAVNLVDLQSSTTDGGNASFASPEQSDEGTKPDIKTASGFVPLSANRHFWAEGYYVSTVGLNEATIKKYIQDQEKHDIAMDKLSVKEYEDPFKGSQ